MKYLSLFSGIGGFEIGINKAFQCTAEQSRSGVGVRPEGDSTDIQGEPRENATCIGYSEIDPYADAIYRYNFGGTNYGDITAINPKELPDFELLVGGFPCQAFSIAGKRRGFDDTRGIITN